MSSYKQLILSGLVQYENFLGLVARLRDLQIEQETAELDFSNTPYYEKQYKKMRELEKQVDNWIKDNM